MKKFFYSVLAIAAIVACAKEKKIPVEDVKSVEKTTYTITAFVNQEETKTSYDANKKFSWVPSDSIFVRCISGDKTKWGWRVFKGDGEGASKEFAAELEDYWRPYDIAVYMPSEQVASQSYNGSNVRINLPISYHLDGVGLGVDPSSGDNTPYYNSISVPSDNPFCVLPLIGKPQTDGSFKFQTAIGVVNLNFTDLPDDAAYVELSNSNLSLGNYLMVDTAKGEINNTAYWSNGSSKYATSFVDYYFTPDSEKKASLNIPLPVGTYDTNTKITIYSASGESLFSKTFAKDVVVERNKILTLAPLKAKFDWVSVGKGKYKDAFLWNVGKFADEFVDVDIDVNEAGAYRIDPYKAAKEKFSYTPEGTVSGPLPLLITIQPDGYVYYDETPSGIYGGSYEYAVSAPYYWSSNYPSYYGSYGKGNNFVAKYDAEGKPANIIMSPVYTSVTTSSFTADNYIWANTIQLVFPGASEIDIDAEIGFIEIADDDPAAPKVKFAAYLGADIESLQIATGATPDEAAAAITAGENVTTVTATGEVEVLMPANSPSGNYYAVAKVIAGAGLAPVVNRYIVSNVFHYDNPDADLGLDESVLYGQWSGDITWNRSGSYNAATFTITLAESQSPLEGNIVVTEFMGYEGTGTGYMDFNTATGALTIPNGTPIAKYNANYNLGMDDANHDGNGYFVFRYDPVAKTLSLEDIQFIGFDLYNVSDGADSGRWIGYCYGPSSNNNKLLLTKVETQSSSPALSKKADVKPLVTKKGKCSLAK